MQIRIRLLPFARIGIRMLVFHVFAFFFHVVMNLKLHYKQMHYLDLAFE